MLQYENLCVISTSDLQCQETQTILNTLKAVRSLPSAILFSGITALLHELQCDHE